MKSTERSRKIASGLLVFSASMMVSGTVLAGVYTDNLTISNKMEQVNASFVNRFKGVLLVMGYGGLPMGNFTNGPVPRYVTHWYDYIPSYDDTVAIHFQTDSTDPTADQSSIGTNTGDIVGTVAYTAGSNGMMAWHDFDTAVEHMDTYIPQGGLKTVALWAGTNATGPFRLYVDAGGTEYVNGVAESFNNADLYTTNSDRILWFTNSTGRFGEPYVWETTALTAQEVSDLYWVTAAGASNKESDVSMGGWGMPMYMYENRDIHAKAVYASQWNYDVYPQDFAGDHVGAYGAGGAAPTFVTGVSNAYLDVGSGDWVKIVDHDDYSFTNGAPDLPWTVGLLVSPDGFGRYRTLVSKYGAGGVEWMLLTDYSGLIWAYTQDNDAGGYRGRKTGNWAVTNGVWQFVVWTNDGGGSNGSSRIYVNAVQKDATDFSGGSYGGQVGTPTDVYWGCMFVGMHPYDGKMDEPFILRNHAMTPTEITNAYQFLQSQNFWSGL